MALAVEKAQGKADEHGQVLDRRRWSAMSPLHVAPTEAQAREEVRFGLGGYIDYIRQILPVNVPVDSDVDRIVDTLHLAGHGVVGTPEMAVRHIERVVELSGGIGTFLIEHAGWAGFEHSKASMELFAREVAPHFSGSTRARKEAHSRELLHDQLTRRTMAKEQAAADLRHSREASLHRRAAVPVATAPLPGGSGQLPAGDVQAPSAPQPASAGVPGRLRGLWNRAGSRASGP